MNGLMNEMMELPLVSGVLCQGEIRDGGLALWRQREERLRVEVDAALEVLKAWDWYDEEVSETMEMMDDFWPDADGWRIRNMADNIGCLLSDGDMSGGISGDVARLCSALDDYADALFNLAVAEKEEADRLGLVRVV